MYVSECGLFERNNSYVDRGEKINFDTMPRDARKKKKSILKLSSMPPYLLFRGWGDKAEPNPDLELNLTRILFLFPLSNHYVQISIIVN